MKRSIRTILMVALLVLPAGTPVIAQEGTPSVPDFAGELHALRLPAPSLQGEAAVPWFPPERSGPGAVITVTTTDDELNSDGDCALREAIEAANTDAVVDACVAGNGDDTVLVPAGTYLLALAGANEDGNKTGDLDILDNVTLTGDGAEVTILDGDSLDRVVQIHTGRTVEISALTVTGGRVDDMHGSGIDNQGTLTLNFATLRGNVVESDQAYGGALANEARIQDATAYVNHSLIADNAGGFAAGLASIAGSSHTAELHVDHTTVISNTASTYAGGLYNGYYVDATDCVSILTLTDSLIAANAALGDGGGGGILTIGEEADNCYAWMTMERTTVRDNTGINNQGPIGAVGAGVLIRETTSTMLDSTISHNIGTGVGELQPALGGGVAIWDSSVTFTNSTISGNEVLGQAGGSGAGGGILLAAVGAPSGLTLLNVTLVGNSATWGGGAILVAKVGTDTPAVTFKNTLIGGNTAPEGTSCFSPDLGYGLGEFISLGHNLEDHDLCEFDQPTDWPNIDAPLGPLQDNGGPTWTHALLEGSLAREHGDDAACPPADQRGVPRPQGPHCDIGSFEAYPDENAPTVMAVSPPKGALDVALDATLVITFSEPISVPTFAYSVTPNPGGWTESWGPNNTVVSLTHELFAPVTVYTASVAAAEDRAGNPMTAPYAWSFSTIACNPVETVTVEGPASLSVDETGVYSATYAPITAAPPVTLTWQDGTVGANAVYGWTLPGTYTLTVTATNPCGEAVGSFLVEVSPEVIHRIYLPMVLREG